MSDIEPKRRGNPNWKKGVSGNPKGRNPKEQAMTKVLHDVLNEEYTDDKGKKYIGKEAVARKLLAMAMAGDGPSLRYLYDRIDGTPRQAVELSGPDGDPIQESIVVEFVNNPNPEDGE